MLHRLRRLAARLLAVGLLAATLFVADSLALPSPAEARCTGVNHPVRSTFTVDVLRASEEPVSGTCNRNQLYRANLVDERYDDFCVEVQFKETGIGWTTPAYGWACETSSFFEWRDRNSNSYVYQRFCIWSRTTGSVYCGWGDRFSAGYGDSPYGVNSGF